MIAETLMYNKFIQQNSFKNRCHSRVKLKKYIFFDNLTINRQFKLKISQI